MITVEEPIAPEPAPLSHRQIMAVFSGLMLGLLIAFGLTWLMREIPLRDRPGAVVPPGGLPRG